MLVLELDDDDVDCWYDQWVEFGGGNLEFGGGVFFFGWELVVDDVGIVDVQWIF